MGFQDNSISLANYARTDTTNILNKNGDQTITGLDPSKVRTGTWSDPAVLSGSLYTLLGELCMLYITHNAAIDTGGNFVGRDETDACFMICFTESGLEKRYSAVTNTAGVVPTWVLKSTSNILTGSQTINGTGTALTVSNANSTTTQQVNIGGSVTFNTTGIHGVLIAPTMTGGATTTSIRGLLLAPSYTPGTSVTTINNFANNITLNNGASVAALYGSNTAILLGASALGGTISAVYGQNVNYTPNVATTTNITTWISYFAPNIANGALQVVNNVRGFQGLIDTLTVTAGAFIVGGIYKIVTVGTTDFTLIGAASNTVGVTFTATGAGTGTGTASQSRYNAYMSGTAPNYFAGNVGIGTLTPTAALDVNGVVKTAGYTVATLPVGVVGARAYVTDAFAPTFLGALTGGGTVTCPVFFNGTIWVSA